MISDSTLGLCGYQNGGFTKGELEALEEYDEQLTLKGYFDLEELLEETGAEIETALRIRARELAWWHDALIRLMADPRIENERRHENPYGPRPDEKGKGPYGGAVTRFLTFAASDYHRHRRGYEYAVTRWALGFQDPDSYPPDTRNVDHHGRGLKLWD